MAQPIFLIEQGGDITCYRPVAELTGHIEAIDVENDEYVAFDGAGQKLGLAVTRDDDVTVTPTGEYAPDVLLAHLCDFVGRVGSDHLSLPTDPAGSSLEDVSQVVARFLC